jgi:4-diphosphocytidyl-2-C-methyl-D-erythritol kinase
MTRSVDRLAPVARLAPAKLNLTLAVVGRRSDGFHELHSVMAPLALADRLTVAIGIGERDSLHVVGPDGEARDAAGYDSVLRAIAEARRIVGRRAGTPPLAARLEKRIPVAAGLAGGSSDAAAALLAAFEAWDASPDPAERHEAAARLGSDVPFFLAGGIALVRGRGERVAALPAPIGAPPAVLLVTPPAPSSTAGAFAAFDAGGPAAPVDPGATRLTSEHLATELASGLRSADLVTRAGVLAAANDLVPAAELQVPGLRSLRLGLRRLLGTPIGVSGSGPTLWALYASGGEAADAGRRVAAAIDAGSLDMPGSGTPFISATTIATPDASASGPGQGREAP